MTAVLEKPKRKPMSKIAQAALDHVNNIRSILDEQPLNDLPSGKPGSVWECPIARGIPRPACVGMSGTVVTGDNGETHEFNHNRDVAEFQTRFDRFQIQQYVTRKELRKWQTRHHRYPLT